MASQSPPFPALHIYLDASPIPPLHAQLDANFQLITLLSSRMTNTDLLRIQLRLTEIGVVVSHLLAQREHPTDGAEPREPSVEQPPAVVNHPAAATHRRPRDDGATRRPAGTNGPRVTNDRPPTRSRTRRAHAVRVATGTPRRGIQTEIDISTGDEGGC